MKRSWFVSIVAVLFLAGCVDKVPEKPRPQPVPPVKPEPPKPEPPKPEPPKPEPPKPEAFDIKAAHEKALALLTEKKREAALELYQQILAVAPDDPTALYNSACAYSLLGNKEKATAFLTKAVAAGFDDIELVKTDPDLASIREDEAYKKIVASAPQAVPPTPEVADKALADRMAQLKQRGGPGYEVVADKDTMVIVVSNLPAANRDRLVNLLRSFGNSHWRHFFKHKPSYYITVVIPRSIADAGRFGGSNTPAGYYNTGTKTLFVNLASGEGTMIHEFTHALHFADMGALHQDHAFWTIEGFGSLFEGCRMDNGEGLGTVNWRLPAAQQVIGTARYIPLQKLMSMSMQDFMRDAAIAYAEARYVFYYLQEKKLLDKFYKEYTTNYAADRTGVKALEKVCGKKLEELEPEWQAWVKTLRFRR